MVDGKSVDEGCYCEDIDGVKERLLIASDDDQYDDELYDAVNEACCYINMRLHPYVSNCNLPIADPDCILKVICGDLAAGIFKRRHMPQDMDQGWWGNGLRKLDEYIKTHYFQGKFTFVKAVVCNQSVCCEDTGATVSCEETCYKTVTVTTSTCTTTETTTQPPT